MRPYGVSLMPFGRILRAYMERPGVPNVGALVERAEEADYTLDEQAIAAAMYDQPCDDQPDTGPEGIDASRTKPDDEWFAIRCLTVHEMAEKLGISVEAAYALVVASLKSKHKEGRCAKEETALLEASFKPIEDGSLWEKDGVYYGREAVAQEARRKLSEGDDDYAV